jgi:hypothetical protein
MSLLSNNLSFDLKKQSKSVCSKIAVPSVAVLLEIRNKTNPDVGWIKCQMELSTNLTN